MHSWRAVLLLLLLLATSALGQDLVVISDLHLGYGRDSSGNFHPQEEAQDPKALDTFLTHLDRSTGSHATLVMAGDVFELWEADLSRCIGTKTLGCTEHDAVERIDAIIAAHRKDEITSLRRFATTGNNHLIIIPGNHDGAVLFHAVADHIRNALGRVEIATSTGYWIANRNVFIEHGHQFDPTNQYKGWPRPFETADGVEHLRRPFGEQFVREYFDLQETHYPIVDNFSNALSGIGYARRAGASLTQAARDFVRFYLHGAALQQKLDVLSKDGGIPNWNVPETRKLGLAFLLHSVPADDAIELLAADVDNDTSNYTDEDIRELCTSRWLQWKNNGEPKDAPLCPGDLSLAVQKIASAATGRELALERYLANRITKLRQQQLLTEENVLYVYGHTHATKPEFRITSVKNTTAVNTGAWQRIISDLGVKHRQLSPDKVLTTLTMERLPACYSYLTITGTTPTIHYWTEMNGTYEPRPSCPDRE